MKSYNYSRNFPKCAIIMSTYQHQHNLAHTFYTSHSQHPLASFHLCLCENEPQQKLDYDMHIYAYVLEQSDRGRGEKILEQGAKMDSETNSAPDPRAGRES